MCSSDLADHSAECLVKSLKCCMSAFYSEAELPSFTAGETNLKHGRVSGLWKVSRGKNIILSFFLHSAKCKKILNKIFMVFYLTGGASEMENTNGKVELIFPLLLRGVACSYDFQ